MHRSAEMLERLLIRLSKLFLVDKNSVVNTANDAGLGVYWCPPNTFDVLLIDKNQLMQKDPHDMFRRIQSLYKSSNLWVTGWQRRSTVDSMATCSVHSLKLIAPSSDF